MLSAGGAAFSVAAISAMRCVVKRSNMTDQPDVPRPKGIRYRNALQKSAKCALYISGAAFISCITSSPTLPAKKIHHSSKKWLLVSMLPTIAVLAISAAVIVGVGAATAATAGVSAGTAAF